ncbi:prepilin-type N-terminal cleavage/methylation domain-containing protein [Chromobacterium paludis]|uniref:Prepilin-type N-terminal cleavage/methylation domain-containing protein n=1 Tax=Chromobacterium paludis TaxID=2605945 RepID=A0A5C1DNI9_9NEIS|nr:prepilin-type N-terminal cleavage/methylation domain-containing protein [Chromobacterium paludis]QEL57657.1 hypothetical protein FYK34_19845 [Chromobacterium paludis]
MSRKTIRGVSLLELLVGMTIGLLLLLAMSTLLVGLLGSQSHDRRQAQLGAMLDGALSLMAMELRRAGYWSGTGAVKDNPFGKLYIEMGGACLRYAYDAPPPAKSDGKRYFAFRLKRDAAGQGRIQRLAADQAGWSCSAPDAQWDDLSKPEIGVIDALRFAPDGADAISLSVSARVPANPDDEKLDIRTSVTLRNQPVRETK